MTRWVLHVDMDQFLAAVELLRHPELVGKPVVVGGRGDPTERAVVSTASYEARAYGVRSGMALRIARRRCPEAIFLPVDFAKYQAVSQTVMRTLRDAPGAVVQVLGWDEAFIGVSTEDPERFSSELQQAVYDATGLHCSVGIGDTLVRAKTATGFGKPQGRFRLTGQNWAEVMGARSVTALWGVGARIAQRLDAMGIRTVAELMDADQDALAEEFGPNTGPYLRRLGRGEGSATVDATPWVPRAHGRETTYQRDLTTVEECAAALRTLADQVVADIRAEGRPCARVHLKVRFVPFFTFTRIRKLARPTQDPAVIAQTALDLLTGLEDDRPIRLLGVRAEMVAPEGGYESRARSRRDARRRLGVRRGTAAGLSGVPMNFRSRRVPRRGLSPWTGAPSGVLSQIT